MVNKEAVNNILGFIGAIKFLGGCILIAVMFFGSLMGTLAYYGIVAPDISGLANFAMYLFIGLVLYIGSRLAEVIIESSHNN